MYCVLCTYHCNRLMLPDTLDHYNSWFAIIFHPWRGSSGKLMSRLLQATVANSCLASSWSTLLFHFAVLISMFDFLKRILLQIDKFLLSSLRSSKASWTALASCFPSASRQAADGIAYFQALFCGKSRIRRWRTCQELWQWYLLLTAWICFKNVHVCSLWIKTCSVRARLRLPSRTSFMLVAVIRSIVMCEKYWKTLLWGEPRETN